MWTYSQREGRWSNLGVGYSGKGEGKNEPDMQSVKDVGPLPRGRYVIEQAYTHPKLGPITMNLTPDPSNEMFGRTDFRIHGDLQDDPGNASEGCVVLDHVCRFRISMSPDRLLEVVE